MDSFPAGYDGPTKSASNFSKASKRERTAHISYKRHTLLEVSQKEITKDLGCVHVLILHIYIYVLYRYIYLTFIYIGSRDFGTFFQVHKMLEFTQKTEGFLRLRPMNRVEKHCPNGINHWIWSFWHLAV